MKGYTAFTQIESKDENKKPNILLILADDMGYSDIGSFVEVELDGKPMDYTRHRFGYRGDLMKIYDKASKEEKKEIEREVFVPVTMECYHLLTNGMEIKLSQ